MATPGLTQSRYLVHGLNCASRAVRIEAAVRRLPGVVEVSTSACAGILVVTHADDELVATSIERQVRSLGHSLTPIAIE